MFFEGPNISNIELSNLSRESEKRLIEVENRASQRKFIISIMLILLGSVFIYKGITHPDSLIVFKMGEVSIEFNNSMPGVFLCFFGFLLMLFSGIKMKLKKK